MSIFNQKNLPEPSQRTKMFSAIMVQHLYFNKLNHITIFNRKWMRFSLFWSSKISNFCPFLARISESKQDKYFNFHTYLVSELDFDLFAVINIQLMCISILNTKQIFFPNLDCYFLLISTRKLSSFFLVYLVDKEIWKKCSTHLSLKDTRNVFGCDENNSKLATSKLLTWIGSHSSITNLGKNNYQNLSKINEECVCRHDCHCSHFEIF